MSRTKGSKNKPKVSLVEQITIEPTKDLNKQEIKENMETSIADNKNTVSATITKDEKPNEVSVVTLPDTQKQPETIEKVAKEIMPEKTETAITIQTDAKPNVNKGVPPNFIPRNSYGLCPNLDYVFNSEGSVNWKAMLKPKEHIVLNRQKKDEIEKIYKKPFNEIDIIADNVEEKHQVLLLAGIRYLAALRGFTSVEFFPHNPTPDYSVVVAKIKFIGNYETDNQPVEFQSTAERSIKTTIPPFNNFLTSLAENAAFSRCVRNFLRISIVVDSEITGIKNENTTRETTQDDENPTSPASVLKAYLAKRGSNFTKLKEKLVAKVDNKGEKIYPEAEKWDKPSDLPAKIIFSILSQLKEKEEETKKV